MRLRVSATENSLINTTCCTVEQADRHIFSDVNMSSETNESPTEHAVWNFIFKLCFLKARESFFNTLVRKCLIV